MVLFWVIGFTRTFKDAITEVVVLLCMTSVVVSGGALIVRTPQSKPQSCACPDSRAFCLNIPDATPLGR